MVIIRILIGLLFIVSGFEKLISPPQNFIYVLQAYQVLPTSLEMPVAICFPWAELIVGLFVLVGLWTPIVLRLACCYFGVFIVIVGQALLRGINLSNCGCFGALIHVPPQWIIVMDSAMLLSAVIALKRMRSTQKLSLDRLWGE